MVFRWRAGEVITAHRLNAGQPVLVTQENDQTITDQEEFEPSEISFLPEPNAVYAYWLYISYSAHSTPDFVWRWPATGTGVSFASFTQAYHRSASGGINSGSEIIFRRPANSTNRLAGGIGADNYLSAYDSGTFESDGDPSTTTMEFAQASASDEPTTLRGGNQTRMLYMRIG
ncbi:hypothetical protein [Nocardiopsis oceani]